MGLLGRTELGPAIFRHWPHHQPLSHAVTVVSVVNGARSNATDEILAIVAVKVVLIAFAEPKTGL